MNTVVHEAAIHGIMYESGVSASHRVMHIAGRISRGYGEGGLWNIVFYSLSHRQVAGLLRVIFHAEYAPLPRIVYFVGKWAISGHPWATIFMANEKSVRT